MCADAEPNEEEDGWIFPDWDRDDDIKPWSGNQIVGFVMGFPTGHQWSSTKMSKPCSELRIKRWISTDGSSSAPGSTNDDTCKIMILVNFIVGCIQVIIMKLVKQ